MGNTRTTEIAIAHPSKRKECFHKLSVIAQFLRFLQFCLDGANFHLVDCRNSGKSA